MLRNRAEKGSGALGMLTLLLGLGLLLFLVYMVTIRLPQLQKNFKNVEVFWPLKTSEDTLLQLQITSEIGDTVLLEMSPKSAQKIHLEKGKHELKTFWNKMVFGHIIEIEKGAVSYELMLSAPDTTGQALSWKPELREAILVVEE